MKTNQQAFTLIKWVGQALPDNAPAKGHTAAFTLIELLVVVLIIGILATVAAAQYQKAIKKTRFAKMRAFAASLIKASQAAYLRTGTFPTTFDELDITVPGDMTIVPTTGNSPSSNYCATREEFYCCLTFPHQNYDGAGFVCAFNDLSIVFVQRYATTTGTRTNISCCVQKTKTETFCQQLPGATTTNGEALSTPTGYVYGYTYYNID